MPASSRTLPDEVVFAVGRRVAEARRSRGLTQQDVATKLDVALKYYQRIESGFQNLTVRTIAKLAVVLDVPVDSLLQSPTDLSTAKGRPLGPLLPEGDATDPFVVSRPGAPGAVPLLTLQAAAGLLERPSEVEVAAWVIPRTRRRLGDTSTLFIARVTGRSMQPKIADGSYCLFRAKVPTMVDGEILLVEHRALAEAEGGQVYGVKRVRLQSTRGRHGKVLFLESINPEFPPLRVELPKVGVPALRLIATFIEQLGPKGRAAILR